MHVVYSVLPPWNPSVGYCVSWVPSLNLVGDRYRRITLSLRFEASQDYIVNPRLAWATECSTVSKRQRWRKQDNLKAVSPWQGTHDRERLRSGQTLLKTNSALSDPWTVVCWPLLCPWKICQGSFIFSKAILTSVQILDWQERRRKKADFSVGSWKS